MRATKGHGAVPHLSGDEAAKAIDQAVGMKVQPRAEAELAQAEVAQKFRFMGWYDGRNCFDFDDDGSGPGT